MRHRHAIMYAALALCFSTALSAQAPSDLESSQELRQDSGDRDSWTYRNPDAQLGRYQSFIIAPTEVYDDPTATWDGTSAEKRREYAAMLTDALREEIGEGYRIVTRPGPDVAVMRLTLLGVEGTTTVAATASRATPFGLALNGVKSIAGKPGSFTGSVQVAFELTDSRSGDLLFAAVRKRSPDALDIPATLSTDATVEAVARDIATAIRRGVDRVNGR